MGTQIWINIIAYAVSIGVIYGGLSARIKALEKKMDKHNGIVEKTYKNEECLKSIKDIELPNIKEDLKILKGIMYHAE